MRKKNGEKWTCQEKRKETEEKMKIYRDKKGRG